MEVVRHKSAYRFFYEIINNDSGNGKTTRPGGIEIVDLGCGVGHGSHMMSYISGSRITGVDSSKESLEFARQNYARKNIKYAEAELSKFITDMPECDYAVSHQVLEHVAAGLDLAKKIKYRKRLMFDVPYGEASGNPHHLLLGIKEDDFSGFPDAELFYQDLDGIIYDSSRQPPKPNIIICACRVKGLPLVSESGIEFPFPAWEYNFDENNAFDRPKPQINPPEAPMESIFLFLRYKLEITEEKLRSSKVELDEIRNSRGWKTLSFIKNVKKRLPFLNKI
jgi:SAM-dependent methyltransferase